MILFISFNQSPRFFFSKVLFWLIEEPRKQRARRWRRMGGGEDECGWPHRGFLLSKVLIY